MFVIWNVSNIFRRFQPWPCVATLTSRSATLAYIMMQRSMFYAARRPIQERGNVSRMYTIYYRILHSTTIHQVQNCLGQLSVLRRRQKSLVDSKMCRLIKQSRITSWNTNAAMGSRENACVRCMGGRAYNTISFLLAICCFTPSSFSVLVLHETIDMIGIGSPISTRVRNAARRIFFDETSHAQIPPAGGRTYES